LKTFGRRSVDHLRFGAVLFGMVDHALYRLGRDSLAYTTGLRLPSLLAYDLGA
jgi:hypothetical protein